MVDGQSAPAPSSLASTDAQKSQGQAAQQPPRDLPPDEIFSHCSPSVVRIAIRNDAGKVIGHGSGFELNVAKLQGAQKYVEVVTNYHVIRPAVDAEVEFDNGEMKPALWVLAESELCDVAILGVAAPNQNPIGLNLALETPAVGKNVFAIGHPLGLKNNVQSPGSVTSWQTLDDGTGITYLQFTAAISQGSSGGPLVNSQGEVVGITTLYLKGGQNLNFAVPSALIQDTRRDWTPREVWRGASIHQEEVSALESLRQTLTKEGRQASDPTLQFVQTYNNRDLSASRRLPMARAALQSAPAELKYLVDFSIGQILYVIAFKKSRGFQGEDLQEWYARKRNVPEYKQAVAALKSSTRLMPTFIPSWLELAQCQSGAGDFSEAIIAANQVVMLAPRSDEAYSKRADCYAGLGQLDKAIDDYRTAISLNPTNYFSREGLGQSLHKLGELSDAVDSLEAAIAVAHEDGESDPSFIWEELAETYFDMRDYRKALAAYENIAEPVKSSPYVQTQIARCEKSLGDE